MPTEYVNEDHVTFGNDLFFPNVQSCAAVIVQTDGTTDFGGYHITVASKKAELDAAGQYLTTSMLGGVCAIYVIGNYRRVGASGVGANSTLAAAIRTALTSDRNVQFLQSPPAWMHGIAVRIRSSAMMPGQPELLVTPPGQWAVAANAMPGGNMRKIRQNGALIVPARPLPTGTMNGNPSPWAIGSLEVG